MFVSPHVNYKWLVSIFNKLKLLPPSHKHDLSHEHSNSVTYHFFKMLICVCVCRSMEKEMNRTVHMGEICVTFCSSEPPCNLSWFVEGF